ncbi:MAG: riboflavin synthase, partial [Candidatus Firestonebacteria bacterium]|nr:riboflavin synthase [Candidatus Firestonebacteria bacterium]
MFTGIIEETGIIKKIKHEQEGLRLYIKAKKVIEDIKLGESISIDGVCLTVETWEKDSFAVYVMPESIRKTTLSKVKIGQIVNLEKALPLNGRLGGHFVLGHVDTSGTIVQITKEASAKIFKIIINDEFSKFLIKKGSIAVNGVSLTIVDSGRDFFTVSIIPHTQQITNLGIIKIEDRVNIEFDIIAKHVATLVTPFTSTGLTQEKLI